MPAIICNARDVKAAADAAHGLNGAIRQHGVAFEGANEALRALQWRQSAIASEAVLTALDFYIERGGGSRGARAVCSPRRRRIPQARAGPFEDVRFIPERDEDRAEQIHVRHGRRATFSARRGRSGGATATSVRSSNETGPIT